MVVCELLDPPHVLHEQFLRRRRDETLELPLLPDRVDEIKPAREDGEESEERLPHDVRTVRKAVGLFDVSHMGKIFVEGSASHDFLHRLSANEISSTPARARYTHLLRDDGTIIDDVIVTCLAPDRFFLVCNAGPRVGVVSWLKNHMTEGVRLADRTLEFLCLAVQGPRAPEL